MKMSAISSEVTPPHEDGASRLYVGTAVFGGFYASGNSTVINTAAQGAM